MSSNEELVIGIKQGKELKNELYRNIYRLLYKLCKRFLPLAERLGYEMGDLLSASWFGVEKAIKAYNPEKGFKFSTYLSYHVSSTIKEFLGLRGTKEKLKYISLLRLDAPVDNQENEDITLLDSVKDSGAEEPFLNAEFCDYYNVLISEIDKLSQDKSEVIKRHFLGNESITDIAQEKNVSIEYIAAKKRKAIWELRKSHNIRECYYSEYSYHHVGVKEFKNTWTSSTEWAALKVMSEENANIY